MMQARAVRRRKRKFKPPEWRKKLHHVVPVSWQRKFATPGHLGRPYYRNLITGKKLGPVGPGAKMAVMYGNIVFDQKGFPIDQLEDRLGQEETALMPILESVLSTGRIEPAQRPGTARFLALQICRYPENYKDRLGVGQLLALELLGIKKFANVAQFNAHLQKDAKYAAAGTSITQMEFEHFAALTGEQLETRIERVVYDHLQSDEGLNPNSVIDAAGPIADHLAGLDWELLESKQPAFVLSDRPVPHRITGAFSVSLGARFALKINARPVANLGPVTARLATTSEVDQINKEVEARGKLWLCGPSLL